jgi:3-hydroxyacyl-CoA dehydrogenase/enoyl-CoA hydratase/3-hydroxybutyryl-CoA epimerase
LQRVIESGRLGRKAKKGFYKYDDAGKRRGVDDDVYDLTPARGERRDMTEEDIRDRTILPMLNEAVACLEEGIIRSPRDGDIGAVFGIGFPPFLGGPFRYIDTVGARDVVRRLDALATQHPGRFTVTSRLRAMAENDERFHSDSTSAYDNTNGSQR